MKKYLEVPIDLVDTPVDEIRSVISQEGLEELVDSIRRVGIIQPLTLRAVGDRYVVICGHRRLLAARMAGLAQVPGVIQEGRPETDDIQKLHENICRTAVNPVDEGRYLSRLIEKYSYSRDDLARMIGRSRSYIDGRIAVIGYPEDIQAALEAGQIEITVARHLSGIDDDHERMRLLTTAIESGATAQVVQRWKIDYDVSRGERAPSVYVGSESAASQQEVKFMTRCPFCAAEGELQNMLVVRLCRDCYDEIQNIALQGGSQ